MPSIAPSPHNARLAASVLALGLLWGTDAAGLAAGLPKRPPPLTSGRFALTFDASSSHSCSRSYASDHDKGTLRLTLTRKRVELGLDMTRWHTFGEARHRYLPRRPGSRAARRRRPPTHRRERWTYSWQGQPRRQASGRSLEVSLKLVKSHCQVLPLSGMVGAVRIPCRTSASLTLRCQRGLAQAYGPTPKGGAPSYPGKTESTQQVGALLCRIVAGTTGTQAKSSGEPLWLRSTRAEPSSGQPAQIVLAPAPGLQLFAYKRSRGWGNRAVLRRRR